MKKSKILNIAVYTLQFSVMIFIIAYYFLIADLSNTPEFIYNQF